MNSLLGRLFLRKHFGIHRIFGLVYLVEWVAAFYLYWLDYGRFERSFLVWALPLSGVAQTVIAIRTFTFLPKKEPRQGLFTTRRVMSFDFIKENLFFAGILCFQWFYMTDRYSMFCTSCCCILMISGGLGVGRGAIHQKFWFSRRSKRYVQRTFMSDVQYKRRVRLQEGRVVLAVR